MLHLYTTFGGAQTQLAFAEAQGSNSNDKRWKSRMPPSASGHFRKLSYNSHIPAPTFRHIRRCGPLLERKPMDAKRADTGTLEQRLHGDD
jgi:hypothetical protein